jgi:nuclear GTP-binding protein
MRHYLFQARKRKLGLLEDEDIANLASAASMQGSEFAAKDNAPLAVAKSSGKFLISHLWLIALLHAVTLFTKDVKRVLDHSERSFYKELVKVIEASDVILEVLDARDPLGTRCIDMEKMVRKADPSKRIVLLLNKIGIMQCFVMFKVSSMVVMPSYISTSDS